MSEKERKPVLTQNDIMKLLDSCYEKCLNGVPKVSPSVENMANDYLQKYNTKENACKAMMRNQIAKCTTSGFGQDLVELFRCQSPFRRMLEACYMCKCE